MKYLIIFGFLLIIQCGKPIDEVEFISGIESTHSKIWNVYLSMESLKFQFGDFIIKIIFRWFNTWWFTNYIESPQSKN